MGGTITAVNEGLDGKVNSKTDGASGGSTQGTSTASPETRAPAGARGTDSPSAPSGGEKILTSEKADGLSILTDEERTLYATANETEKKRILKNAKRRQRYAEQKQSKGQTVKPRKVNGNKKDTSPALDVTQLNLIIAGVSTAIASRPNCQHWLLSEAEINSITVPLSKMLAESEMFSGMGQYSNQIALVMACLTVFAPRLFITLQMTKEAKNLERTGQHTDTNYRESKSGTPRKTKDSNIKSDNRADRNTPANGRNDDKDLFLFGSPIA